jgi:hypothetical protein
VGIAASGVAVNDLGGSLFLQPKTSRFLKKVATPVLRYLVRHPTVSRFVRKVPFVSWFLGAPWITPVYNQRARRPRLPMLRM